MRKRRAASRAKNPNLVPGTAERALAPYMRLLESANLAEPELAAVRLGLFLLWLADDVIAEVDQRLEPFDISESKLDVLLLIHTQGTEEVERLPPTPTSISEYVGVTRATVTGMLDWLEKRKLVIRKRHATDRRSLHAEITPSGRKLIKGVLPVFWSACRELTRDLNQKDQQDLYRILSKLWTHFKARNVK